MGNAGAAWAAPPGWAQVLEAIVAAAIEATEAAAGCVLLAGAGGDLRVVASAGRPGGEAAARDPAGYVVASGQPIALSPAGGSFGVATSVLCVPCAAGDAVVGALAVVDKAEGATFTYEDLELATLLAGIAGTVLGVAAAAGPA